MDEGRPVGAPLNASSLLVPELTVLTAGAALPGRDGGDALAPELRLHYRAGLVPKKPRGSRPDALVAADTLPARTLMGPNQAETNYTLSRVLRFSAVISPIHITADSVLREGYCTSTMCTPFLPAPSG